MRSQDFLYVENAQHDGKIEQDKQKQCAVVDEDFDGVAVGGTFDGEAVFEGDKKNDRHCEDEQPIVIEGSGHLIHAPKGIEYVAKRQAHGHVAIKKVERIGFEHAAGITISNLDQLAAPFTQCKIKGHGKDGKIEPVGDDDFCQLSAVDDANDKAGGEHGDVGDGHIFNAKAVSQIQYDVEQQKQSCGKFEDGCDEQRSQNKQHNSKNACITHWNSATGDGAAAFRRMTAVLFAVTNIVDDIDGRRSRTECKKAQYTSAKFGRYKELAAADECCKDQQIFHVMMHTHQFEIAVQEKDPLNWKISDTVIQERSNARNIQPEHQRRCNKGTCR